MTDEFDTADFGRQFQQFMRAMSRLAPAPPPGPLFDRLERHLGRTPLDMPVVTATFPPHEHANVAIALDALTSARSEPVALIGVRSPGREYAGLGDIVDGAARHQYGLGAADYQSLPVDVDGQRSCVSFGIFLTTAGDHPVAVLLREGNRRTGKPRVLVEVLAPEPDVGQDLLAELRAYLDRDNIYQGHLISFDTARDGEPTGSVRFHRRQVVPAASVVLPDGALASLDRQVHGIEEHRLALLAAGHRLRRGVLLHGPPGTGKTLVVRHLLSRLPGHTAVVLSGRQLDLVRAACDLARRAAPSVVVLEDVDLVAQDRRSGERNPVLFDILDEMDGTAEDADLTFVLTTNHPGALEDALARRPGRIDLAIQVPLPDADSRHRLLAVHGSSLELSETERAEVVAMTAGATGAFFPELARRATVTALNDGLPRARYPQVRRAAVDMFSHQLSADYRD
ncbi:AAA family ATPase [Micromonospora sp. WMMD961]|uniref:AAA family ATPase n=1 Tax=Micromonospora sp. WMMD961 TaxID=3016100 RepID=UPI00241635F5|nr:AAA family ATPase [Micromonospora sp. WMMD961]MDG4779326.1 AAA family ATPase [Micromonospora sp. WMMD961]